MALASYCWFLTGSQGLYGPETLKQVERQSFGRGRVSASRRIAVRVRVSGFSDWASSSNNSRVRNTSP
jgi:L-arabinose isomerase